MLPLLRGRVELPPAKLHDALAREEHPLGRIISSHPALLYGSQSPSGVLAVHIPQSAHRHHLSSRNNRRAKVAQVRALLHRQRQALQARRGMLRGDRLTLRQRRQRRDLPRQHPPRRTAGGAAHPAHLAAHFLHRRWRSGCTCLNSGGPSIAVGAGIQRKPNSSRYRSGASISAARLPSTSHPTIKPTFVMTCSTSPARRATHGIGSFP